MTGKHVGFALCALVVCPLVGIVVALVIDAGQLVWLVLLGLPAVLTYAAGAVLRLRDWVSVLFALLSAGVGFLVVLAWIIYAASQGMFA
jgi:hypothetical protein